MKKEDDLTKFFNSQRVKVMRSEIHPAEYNPRRIDDDARKQLKKSIKAYGVVGGIIINSRTGNTIVGGHQKVDILDEMNKYPEKDYALMVDVVDVDEKSEKEMNIIFNNPNAMGDWDYDKLRSLVPDIDYKAAGLTDADMSMIGMDYFYKTEKESAIADDLADLMSEADELHQQEVSQRKEQRDAIKQAQEEAQRTLEQAEKKRHMMDVKGQVKKDATEKAMNMDAYIMLSFATYNAKAEFLQRFGYDESLKFINGEDFSDRCEVVYE